MKAAAISNKMKIAASQNIKEKDYWMKKFSGDLVKSFFPYDHKNTDRAEHRVDTVSFRFDGELSSKMVKLSNKSDNRLHILLAAGLIALLEKYTENKDIIVGMPIYKQEIEGEFINTVLPLRNTLEAAMTFKQLILQVRQTIQEANQHQNYPMKSLLYKLNLPPSPGGFALFDAAVLLENIQDKRYLEPIDINLLFSFLRTGDFMTGTLEYNVSLYKKSTIERIVTHLRQLFVVVFTNLGIPLADIDVLPEEERKQILFDFNDTGVEYPKDKTIHQLLEARVEKTPDKIAVIYRDQKLTYQALNEKANQLAGLLRKKGVKPDAIVAIIMEPCLELIIGIIGTLKAGGAYLPIDPGYPAKRILSIIRDSGALVLLTREKIITSVPFTGLKGIRVGNVTPVVTAPRGQIKDFDRLPLPDRTLIDYERYHRYIGIAMARHTVSLQATRGCPYNCVFCHKIWPKSHVARSAENIFEEIKYCYDAGARRFTFIDDVFNLNKENVARLMEKIIKNRLDVQLFFPNGLRGDILTKESIDLMVAAGTVNIDLALESASPRIQKLIKKNLDLETFRENAHYIARKYPQLLLEMELMIGFPTETEEDALMTLDFLKSLKWVHFPNLNILKIYPNSEMYNLAVENGIDPERIERSTHLAFHQLPDTLPFSKRFTGEIQMRFMNEYFLSKERLLQVLPYQAETLTEEELTRKYDSYLPMKIENFPDILEAGRISVEEFAAPAFLPGDYMAAPGFRDNMGKNLPPAPDKNPDALRVLLLDLSQSFSHESEKMLYDMVEEPLGLTYLLTYLNKTFAAKVLGKIGNARIEFDSYDELKVFIREFDPDLIGIRTLSYYREFFHKTVSLIRQWGVSAPIIAGGPYATSDYNLVLGDANVDVVVLGEGELTFAQLIKSVIENHKKLPYDDILKDIPGIAFVKKEDRGLPGEVGCDGRDVVFLDNITELVAPYPPGNLQHVNRPGDLLYLISTSGSSGVPKSLMMEHRNLVNLLNFQFHQTPIDFSRVLQFASIGFDVSSQEIFSALLAGGELYLIDNHMKQEVDRLLELMERNHLNVVYWPPAFFKYVFSEPDYQARFPKSVQHIITAGEQLIVTESIREYMKENRVYVHNHYGPAETHVVTTFTMDRSSEMPEIPPIGKPISNTRIYILDENKKVKPVAIPGELYISGAAVGRGYHGKRELTADKFSANPFVEGERMYRTGDLAKWLPDGNIQFIGRVDCQVKIRGFRIELGEIENRLREITGIREAVLVDLKDPAGEKYLCAYIVPGREVKISKIKDILSDDLPGYMIPAYFVQMEKIPVTSNGKVDKKALPIPELDPGESFVAPGDPVQEKLAGIWSEVLAIGKSAISIDANFFELGGHSLKATILITRIHKTFNAKVTLSELFRQPTIRGLAELIEKTGNEIFSAIKSLEKKQYYPLSSAQKRIYILHQLKPDNMSYNNPSVVILEGDFKREKLPTICRELIDRHETLRTSFEMIEEEPVQRVHDEVEFVVTYNKMSEEDAQNRVQKFIRPFDLSKPPLLRVEVIKIETAAFILMYDMHHIITDGTSMHVFVGEFVALYGGKELPPLRIRYKDFSAWQNRNFQEEAFRKQQKYWLKQLQGEIPILNIPTDYPRPEVKSFEGNTVRFQLGREETRELKKLAEEKNVTLYMALLSIYNVLLAKISGQEDIIIGTAIAGRRHADLHFLIGMFVNTLIMRNYPAGDRTFGEFLTEVRERTLQAFENQDYPFEELVDRIAVNRDTSRNPVFDVMLVLQNMAVQTGTIPEVETPGLKRLPYKHKPGPGVTKFDMTMMGIESGDHLTLVCEYSTRLFKKETIERFISYFKRIATDISKNVEKKISDIEILLEEEIKQLLFDFNGATASYPENKTIPQLFEEQVERTPDYVALVGPKLHMARVVSHPKSKLQPTSNKTDTITYKKLNEKSNQLAHWLIEKGIQPSTILGIMVERSVEMILGILGILKAGGAYLPISLEYPEKRIQYIIKDSAVPLVLTQELLLNRVKFTGAVLQLNDENSFTGSGANPGLVNDAKTPAYIIYTSGSTGTPRGVLVEHFSVVNLAFCQINYFEINRYDRILQFSSISFDASIEQIFISYFSGAGLFLIDESILSDSIEFQNFIAAHLITHIHAVPAFLNNLNIKHSYNLKRIISGGDDCPVPLANKWSKYCDFYNEYGPTETTVTSIEMSVKDVADDLPRIPIGRPINNTTVYLFDKGMKFVPLGVPGELYIGGMGVSRGYLNCPEMTRKKFIFLQYPFVKEEKFYRTGDLARWRPDGNIEFLGRIDQQVKIRGFRIEVGEIESQLQKHEEIIDAAVIARQEEIGDKYLCAYIISGKDLTVRELREYLSGRLPGYMVPAYFTRLDKIPLTPNGKVNHKALPAPEVTIGDSYWPPTNEVERKLVGLWSEILGIEKDRISIEGNFFEMGGHSLKATILAAKIRDEFNFQIPLVDIFKKSTIRELAQYIEKIENKKIAVKDNRLYLLKKSTAASNHLFFIHDGTGEVDGYIELCRHLNNAFNCWGIRADRLNNYTPQNLTIEEVAEKYIETIRNIQPHGPYYITGWSLGGTIAFEIASQLEHANEEIAFLALFDSPPPNKSLWKNAGEFNFKSELDFVKNDSIGSEIEKKLKNLNGIEFDQFWPFVVDYLETNDFDVEMIKKSIVQQGIQELPNYNILGIKESVYYLNVGRTLANARAIYIPAGKINTQVHYFAADQSAELIKERWDRYCGKSIKYYTIPGDHYSIFKQPVVIDFARLFSRTIGSS